MEESATGAREEGDERTQDGPVLFVGGLTALVTALLAVGGDEPLAVVALAVLVGAVGVGGAASEFAGRGPRLGRLHLAVVSTALAGALLAAVTGVLLTAALLALVGAMSAGRLYETLRS